MSRSQPPYLLNGFEVFSVLPNKHGKGSHKTPLGEYRFDLGQFNDCVDGCVETLTCLLARCRDPNATITFSVTGTALESGDADLASIAQEPCLASLDLDAPTPDELEVMRKLREQREKTRQRDRGRSRSRRRKSGDGTEGADDETVDGPGPGTLLRRRSLDERGVPKPRSLSRIPSFGPAFETSPTGMPSFNLPVRNSEKDKEREAGETEKGKGNTALPPLPPDVAQAAERGDAAVLIGRLRVLEKELQEKDSEMFRLKAEHRKEVNSLEEKIRQEQEKGRELEAGHAEQLREKDVQIEKLLEALEQLQEATSTERETPDDDLDEDDRPEGFSFPFRTLNEENERRMASPSSAPERAGEDPNRQLLEDSTFTFKESDLDAAAEIVAESSTPQQKQTSPDGEDEEAEEGENQNIPREATTPPPPERVSTLERLAFGDHHQETQDAPNGEEQGQGQPPYEVHVVSAEGDRRQIAPRDREGTGARSPKSAPSVASERSRRSGRTFRSSRSAAHSVTVVDTVLRAQLEDLKGRLEVKSQRLEECEHRLSELQTEQTRQISEIEAEWEEKCSALQRRVEDMGGEAALSEEEVKDRDRALRNEKEMREKAEKTLADLRATLIDAAAEADEEEDGEEGGRALFSDVGPAGGEEEGGEGEGMQRRSAQTARPTSPRAAAVAMRRQVASMAAEIAELQAINASLQEEKESAISVHRHEIEILQREARDAAEQAQQYISKLQREIAALE
uniref:Uncharacterized protein n=1 Tax=Chromera velia CCMP2878 TaxID=1169474 RepID=A0A0G4FSZ4_9ALVE|eukprot:Cvel_18492.t1-p1 / transcript=Cvel_18492.t1 / gene=Cvel_18492 / organism=Chromera_velia_CCMP2878 / gene_product=hypothetical protein / transcript_product=hypothetical protein / location=Cvel_scaffold1534:25592-30734(+) / protein_length=738 / sequence_SO=supercontig / SO=protein_coding / is_pseudo=false